MKALRVWSVVCALLLSACSGVATSPSGAGGGGSSLPPQQTLAPTSFVFARPAQTASRRPAYITANIASVAIALDSVNGSAPPSGLTTTVTSNITLTACPCTVAGPSVPPGSDTFTVTAYDAAGGSGNVVSVATATYTIAVGAANSNTITLNGVPKSFSFSGLPTATAGTAFAAQAFTVTVKDADGNTILGTYQNPVTIANSDASGATTIATAGSDSPPAGELLGSADTVSIAYTGLAITPATITASATGATGSTTFAPTLQPIVYSGPLVTGNPEIDLFATSGTGSSGSFSAAEVGWTNAPYNKPLTVSLPGGCASIASVSPASGTNFTASAVASPAAGSCTVTLGDGVGQSKAVTLTYTTSSIGVQ